jgi:NAD-dependent deacetylase
MSNEKLSLVFFSGAGMSAESGISTFRDSNGLWENYNIEDVATPEAWRRNPELVQQFYNLRRKQILEVQPNQAHVMIAKLEQRFSVTVITQNIDDLHERAGSTHVLHLHGNIRLAKSSGPHQEKKYYPIEGWSLSLEDTCEEGFSLRPHVVWFGEPVPMYERAMEIIENADILVVIGTSLQVYPAAGLVHYARKARRKILIDPKGHEMQLPADFEIINEGAEKGMKQLVWNLT